MPHPSVFEKSGIVSLLKERGSLKKISHRFIGIRNIDGALKSDHYITILENGLIIGIRFYLSIMCT